METTIIIHPVLGQDFKITLRIPCDRDAEEYVDEFLDSHLNSFTLDDYDWEWA